MGVTVFLCSSVRVSMSVVMAVLLGGQRGSSVGRRDVELAGSRHWDSSEKKQVGKQCAKDRG